MKKLKRYVVFLYYFYLDIVNKNKYSDILVPTKYVFGLNINSFS